MGLLRINKVKYEGDKYFFTSPRLSDRISVIEGVNGTGKTTFFDFIYHGLGGNVKKFKQGGSDRHMEVVSDKNNYVELDLRIGDESFLVTRFISSNDVTILPYEIGEKGEYICKYKETISLPVYRASEEKVIYSDWLLKKLGVDVIELYLGYKKFKVNIVDQLRLVYHNQALDPNKIYKEPDSSGFVSDSELVRKAIFELWMGKSFASYYHAVNECKVAEKIKNEAQNRLQQFSDALHHISGDEEVRNLAYLKEHKREQEQQLVRLLAVRQRLKEKRNDPNIPLEDMEEIQEEFARNEVEISELKSNLYSVYKEKAALVGLKKEVERDAERIAKIIYTHQQLNLFSADTCPFCLGKVDRAKDKCICGSDIDEAQYERFFYSSEEYSRLLKSKLKTVETVNYAIEEISDRENEIQESLAIKRKLSQSHKKKIEESAVRVFDVSDVDTLNVIDDKILALKSDIYDSDRQIAEEIKLAEYQRDFDKKREDFEEKGRAVKSLEAQAEEHIASVVKKFSSKYNSFMVKALAGCRSARISSEDYMPIINNREYREASSSVPKRLMYFLTMLRMSLEEKGVLFPKLLLIDTPETGGIDAENLRRSIEQLEELDSLGDFQVILSTGYKKYPEALKGNVAVSLDKENKLLKKKGDLCQEHAHV
ncbi:hypothetical protein [Halomonas sp. 15WGF]|jgi:hypothetical protein|uniref:hypothetical protein n=1 Tax=Halomonas sp. 15WGF TaxID=2570357 RepID=UPI0010BE8AF5|nr:hypothetical protein [Halomonas sp. 15WGF]TKJ09467.1 hypothetical protein E8Q34_16600 [Halomonas sp. 15WGF]|tara:strand:- start:375 stop:2336 length:1962 start_codon:yes stop_codon:yes gene_type:complete